jgi:hypothetical protein
MIDLHSALQQLSVFFLSGPHVSRHFSSAFAQYLYLWAVLSNNCYCTTLHAILWWIYLDVFLDVFLADLASFLGIHIHMLT